VGKRVLIEQVPKFAVEPVVLIVADLQDPILDPKGVAVIVVQFMTGDLNGPALKVLTVEKTDPAILARLMLFDCTTAKGGYQDQAQDGPPILHYPEMNALVRNLFVGHSQLLLQRQISSIPQLTTFDQTAGGFFTHVSSRPLQLLGITQILIAVRSTGTEQAFELSVFHHRPVLVGMMHVKELIGQMTQMLSVSGGFTWLVRCVVLTLHNGLPFHI
jgi:hypothetical protein